MTGRKQIHAALSIVFLLIAAGAAIRAATAAPKAYGVVEITVTDRVAYQDYTKAVSPLVAKFGGEYIVRGGKIVPLEGEAPTGRFVVIEFPSMAVARKFESSSEYLAIAPLRQRAAHTRLFRSRDPRNSS